MPSMWARRHDGSSRRAGLSVRRPRATLALVVTIVTASVVFSGGVGDGALPTASLPAFGVTAGNGSLSTVAELGDINGDGFGDYAIGMPSADVGTSADAGIVYVFLGSAGALPPAPTALNPAAASFQITGRGGEMLGYAIAGNDVNRDGLSDIAIGAPMAGAPSKAGGGAVYVVFGSRTPATLSTNALSFAGYTNAPTRPATPSPLGSRYDGFQQNGHTGMSLAALPDVNGDGYRDLAVGAPDASLHTPGGGGVAVLYGKPLGVHITLNDLWENGYPYSFHIDYPAIANQHVGMSVASVGDMTGDGWPDIAVGARRPTPPGASTPARSGSSTGTSRRSWAARRRRPPGSARGSSSAASRPRRGYRIDGPVAGAQLGSSLAGIGDQNGDGLGDLAIGQAGASPLGRARAGAVVVVPGQRNAVTRDLAVTAPLQTIIGPAAGAALGSSLAAAGSGMVIGAPGDSSSAGAVYMAPGAPGTTDLALAAKIAPAAAGSMAGSAVAAGSSLDGAGADALIAAPGANGSGGWFVVGG